MSFALAQLILALSASGNPQEGNVLTDMALIPAGSFIMGSNDGSADERPIHTVNLSAYYIDRHEVTNASFAQFVRETRGFDDVEGSWFRYSLEGCFDVISYYEREYDLPKSWIQRPNANDANQRDELKEYVVRWRSARAALHEMVKDTTDINSELRIGVIREHPVVLELLAKQANLPVRGVTWRDAVAYARWAGKRLPTEAEWERAARGTDGRRYPWGGEWNADYCQSGPASQDGPAPVGRFSNGASAAGCLGMAGNVWEWVADWYDERYYASTDGAVDPKGSDGLPNGRLPGPDPRIDLLRTQQQGRETNTRKVIRGGGWGGPRGQARYNTRCTRRLWSNPAYWHTDVGFRCAKDAE